MIKYLLRCLTTTALFLFPAIVQAQVYQPSNRNPVADNTQIGTQVSRNGNNFDITGGLSRGQTLFHSFTDFSVPTGGAANFINPTGNRDIISRVTGGLFSDINGVVNSNGANFLLINPNGIVFGTNAQLNVGRAFMASTANGVNLVDGSGRAITFGTNLNGDAPLLTIAPNVFFNVASLQMGGGNGQINNFGTLQTSNPGQYIGLIGGNVSMNGGKIIAPGGRVDLGGISTNGTVTVDRDGLRFSGNGLARSDVSIANGASVSVRADRRLIPVDPVFFTNAISPGSSINIVANRIDLQRVPVQSNSNQSQTERLNNTVAELDAGLGVNVGNNPEPIGKIYLNSTGDINISGSKIANLIRSGSGGNGGGIQIESTGNLTITNRSGIFTNLVENATGNAGDIDLKIQGNISLYDPVAPGINDRNVSALSTISSSVYGTGDTGKIKINTQGKLLVGNGDTIASTIESSGSGNSRGIEINARELEVRNRGNILSFATASTNPGTAGNIDITTTGNITIAGTDNAALINPNNGSSLSQISSNSQRRGNPGQISISTPGKLAVINKAIITTGIKNGGIGTNLGGTVNPDSINITAGEIDILNQSAITNSTERGGIGNAGNINIRATRGNINLNGSDDMKLVLKNDPAGLSYISSSNSGQGNGGKIQITAKGNFSIANRAGMATISRSTTPDNTAGDLIINANQLNLDRGTISLRSLNATAGNITLNTQDRLLMRNNSFVATDSGSNLSTGNGGNITINSPLIVALPGNNDITANAYAGSGGKVKITTDGLFGIQYRPKGQDSRFTNDITASSTFGQSGSVKIETPGIDPAKGLNDLPIVPADVSNQISHVCSDRFRQNKLTITGRGGLPSNADDPLTSDVIWLDARNLSSPTAPAPVTNQPERLPPPAVGWVFDGKGKVRLISAATEGQPIKIRVVCPKK